MTYLLSDLRGLWQAMQFSTKIGATSRMKLIGLPGLFAATPSGPGGAGFISSDGAAGFFGSDVALPSRRVAAVFEGAASFVAFVWPSSPRAATDESTSDTRNAKKQRINVRDIV